MWDTLAVASIVVLAVVAVAVRVWPRRGRPPSGEGECAGCSAACPLASLCAGADRPDGDQSAAGDDVSR